MSFEYSNWYNDPFASLFEKFEEQESLSKFNRQGKLVCTVAHDGRKQKKCKYYFRNNTTKKCLFIDKGYICGAREDY